MFTFALIYSLGLLAAVNLSLALPRNNNAAISMLRAFLHLICFFYGLSLIICLPIVPMLAAMTLMTLLTLVLLVMPRKFAVLGFICSVGIVLHFWRMGFQKTAGDAVMYADEFPLVSMSARLPFPPPETRVKYENPDVLASMEAGIEQNMDRRRDQLLQAIHESNLNLFIQNPNFGDTRLNNTRWILKGREWMEGDTSQPRYGGGSQTETQTEIPIERYSDPDLATLNQNAVLDFAFPEGFGFRKSRDAVAGFQSHKMRKSPKPTRFWQVYTVDLVGLLLHEQPVVYVTNALPNMYDREKKHTRQLDSFEMRSLEHLKFGADIAIEPNGRDLRMLGAVRCLKQCLDCHEGSRGDLLGAFTYELRSVDKPASE